MTTRTLVVVSAGLSQPSSTRLLADQLTAATQRALVERGVEPAVVAVELRDHAHDLMNNLLAGFPSDSLRRTIETVVAADGLVVVTPIFAASYSGLFKSFFDVLAADSLTGKPVLIAATGGTARHSLALDHALRPLFGYLHALVVPTAVYAATEDWGTGDGGRSRALGSRIDKAAREFAELVQSRGVRGPVDPFADPTPFEHLLGSKQSD